MWLSWPPDTCEATGTRPSRSWRHWTGAQPNAPHHRRLSVCSKGLRLSQRPGRGGASVGAGVWGGSPCG
jgi:hypothetical protein